LSEFIGKSIEDDFFEDVCKKPLFDENLVRVHKMMENLRIFVGM